MQKKLIVIVGATAVGKTAMAIRIAQHFGTEIISADSRQIFREMEIGTAKPSETELASVPHYFINSHSINEDFNAGQFEREALILLEKKFQTHDYMVLVGGSGLYVKALCEGIDEMPEIDAKIRQDLNEIYTNFGLKPLLEELQEKDKVYFDFVDKNNHQRLIRALEIIRQTNKPFSDFRLKKQIERHFQIIKIGLEMDREKLYERIEKRMDLMIDIGLFEEAEKLFSQKHLNSLQTVGYKEIFDFLEGKYDKNEAIRLLKRNSRRYAKRQITWFGADKGINWFSYDDFEGILDCIKQSS